MSKSVTKDLYNLIFHYQGGNNDIFIDIYERFIPLIKKYGNKLNYDGAESDMIISLIEIVNKIPINKNTTMINDAVIVGYIQTAMKNRYIYFSKQNGLINKYESLIDTSLNSESYLIDLTDRIYLKDLLNKLTKKEKNILIFRYINGYSDIEIASALNISRQAVNKTKNRALKNIKYYM